jgi:hypothetical protein
MSAQSVALRILTEGDHKAFRRHWGDLFPHLAAAAPKNDAEAEVSMHYARTISENVGVGLRQYSHRWLTEQNYPSGLPDELRPSAEQVCPRVAAAVGLTVGTKPYSPLIREAMEHAVLDAEADGRLNDDAFVRSRIQEARTKSIRQLFGSAGLPPMKGQKR